MKYKYLKSGLVNFILPCSVAIFIAMGTASSHLDRTHNLSHLQERTANQQQAPSRGGGAYTEPGPGLLPEADLCVRAGVEIVHLLHLLHVGQRKRILQGQTRDLLVNWTLSEVDCSGLKWFTSWSSRDRNSTSWWDDSVFTSDSLKPLRAWSVA